MNCSYFKEYKMEGSLIQNCESSNCGYLPNEQEIISLCKTDTFMSCARFRASLIINRSKMGST